MFFKKAVGQEQEQEQQRPVSVVRLANQIESFLQIVDRIDSKETELILLLNGRLADITDLQARVVLLEGEVDRLKEKRGLV